MFRRVNYLRVLCAAVCTAALGFAGCVTEELPGLPETPDVPAAAGPTLELRIGRSVSSRAGEGITPGTEFSEAEKLVKRVDLFFFEEGATNSSVVRYYAPASVRMNTAEAEKSNQGTLSASVRLEDLFGVSDLRNITSDTDCTVFAVVNNAAATEELLAKHDANGKYTFTLADLKAAKVRSEEFKQLQLEDEAHPEACKNPSFEGFAMFTQATAGDVVTYKPADNALTGTVTVTKLPSKISLSVGFGSADDLKDAGSYTITAKNPNDKDSDTEITWRPYTEEADAFEAYIVNGVQAAYLGLYDTLADAEHPTVGTLAEEDFFDLWYYDEENEHPDKDFSNYAHPLVPVGQPGDGAAGSFYPYAMNAPFYTYPSEWTTGVLEQHRTYLILKVNWMPYDGTPENIEEDYLLETYYKIPLNVETNRVLPNRHYHVKVRINTLGGQHFGEPVLLEDCSCEVLPWGSKTIDANLRDTRYLEVQQTVKDIDGKEYTAIMNNVNTVTIPFLSSHKTEIESIKITYKDLEDFDTSDPSRAQNLEYYSEGVDQVQSIVLDYFVRASKEDLANNKWQGIYIDDIRQTMTIQHYIGKSEPETISGETHYIPNTGDKYKYIPYIIEIVLRHEDNGQMEKKTMTIKHYPPIYVEGEVNTSINLTGYTGSSLTKQVGNYDMYNSGAQMNFFGFVRVNSNEPIRTSGMVGLRLYYVYNYDTIRDNPYGGLEGMTKAGAADKGENNPIMYVITATQLDEEWQDFHIADPRSYYVNNDLTGERLIDVYDATKANEASWSVNARHIDIDKNAQNNNGPKLRFYYPARESLAQEDQWAIAPRFRIGSSFGSHYGGSPLGILSSPRKISREDARKRCASYQEYGYPAGRWRLPTLGELQFVMALSRRKVIPPLFATGQVYFTAQGGYTFASDGTPTVDNENGFTRCVYDDWYWTERDGKPDHLTSTDDMYNNGYVFIWGDREKNNPQVQPPVSTGETDQQP